MALVKIVYASMTGNTEEIADIVVSFLQQKGNSDQTISLLTFK